MANYYHEARAQVRKQKQLEESNRRRAERRAELATAREDLPVHRLQVDGRSCTVYKDTEEYENVEHGKVLMPWNGDSDCLIDRFDARAMLDFYQEPDCSKEKKTEEEREIDERVAFESFRDLVKLVRKGLRDEAGLAYVEDEALDIRVQARSRAAAAAGVPVSRVVPAPSAPPAAYAATGFDYGTQVADGAEGDEHGESSSGDEEDDRAEDDMIEAAEDDCAGLDALAADCGIQSFTAQLQRAVLQEEAEAEHAFKKKKRMSRKKMAERVRRMLGQGLNPFGKSKAWWRETTRAAPKPMARDRGSPDYGTPRQRERGHGRPRERRERHQMEFISEFSAVPHHDSSSDDDAAARPEDEDGAHLEALPGQVDPAAAGGPVALPAAGSVMHGKRVYTYQDREAERAKDAERSRITMNQAVVSKPAGKESRAERLKRLMAAQFNSNVAKDTKKVLQKRAQERSDQQARVAIERHASAMPRHSNAADARRADDSYARDSRRSPSPRRHDGRGRDRSRSRSPDYDRRQRRISPENAPTIRRRSPDERYSDRYRYERRSPGYSRRNGR